MIFPQNIIGPKFGDGDLANFILDESELTLRLPVIPNNSQNFDSVTQIKNLCDVDTRNWDQNDHGLQCSQLAHQIWCYEHATSLDDIAQCSLYVSLVEATKLDRNRNALLSHKKFKHLMLEWIDYSFATNEKPALGYPDKHLPENRYNHKTIAKEHLSWIRALVRYAPDATPSPIVIIPVNNQFVLFASIQIESLHYAGRINPFSNELLKQFELDLFDDFLSHINITYSPDMIKKINALK